jgi:opacity protein-like surface antigen
MMGIYGTLIFLGLALFTGLQAADNVWSQETKALSPEAAQQILSAYDGNETMAFRFPDDPKVKRVSEIEDNILVVGGTLGFGSSSETVSNTTGSYALEQSVTNLRLLLGKDFTFWHEEYTQPTRIYLTYGYTMLSSDVDFTSVTLGIKESMRYWSFYEGEKFSLYPTLSYELGNASLKRGDESISGFISEVAAGVVYERLGFEYGLEVVSNSISWNHPIDGIEDESLGLQLRLTLMYRWMYDE